MESAYDAGYTRSYYDAYGEREWERLASTPRTRVNFHLHRHYLVQYIEAGDAVLEVGAGPGRFTIELAKLGARITVGDISPVQLALNREKLQEAGYDASVESREVLDIVDLSQFPSERFDAVICYGGPLSYVFEQAEQALHEMLRVTKVGGNVLLGVMSLIGSTHLGLPFVLDIARQKGAEVIQRVTDSGNLLQDVAPQGHICHMYRWTELESLLKRHPCELVAASASNCLSMRTEEALKQLEHEPDLWEQFLAWELAFCREPGALDSGTHIIAVVQRR